MFKLEFSETDFDKVPGQMDRQFFTNLENGISILRSHWSSKLVLPSTRELSSKREKWKREQNNEALYYFPR